MAIVYVGNTALEFWRWRASTFSTLEHPRKCELRKIPPGSPRPIDVIDRCSGFVRGQVPVSIMVASKNDRRTSEEIAYTVNGSELPLSSFYRLDAETFVASPEFAITQLATSVVFPELLVICNELTGMYVNSDESIQGWVETGEPVTSMGKLRCFLKGPHRIRGAKKMDSMLGYITPNSASPMENEIAIVLTLPKKLGGYGLPKPKLNHALCMDDAKKRTLNRTSITPDFLWEQQKIAIEYESDKHHQGEMKFQKDSERRNKIRQLGYDVTTVTRKEYASVHDFDLIAEDLRKKLGVHKRPDPEDYYSLKHMLRRQLVQYRPKSCVLDCQ